MGDDTPVVRPQPVLGQGPGEVGEHDDRDGRLHPPRLHLRAERRERVVDLSVNMNRIK